MFIINGSDYTIIVIGIAAALLFFAIQLACCLKAKTLTIKLIPVFIALCMGLFCLATYMGTFGTSSAGAISGNELVGIVIGVIAGIAAVGEVLAWIVYGIYRKTKRKNPLN